MSKFFNDTVKSRTFTPSTPSLVPPAPMEDQKPVSVMEKPAPVEVPDLADARLEQSQKTKVPVAEYFHYRFKGSPAMAPMEESYRALRTRLLRLRAAQGLRSIVVTSATQGEGKTFTSFNLGSCCAQLHGMRVLLIDGDIRTSGLSRMLKLPEGPGLPDILAGKCKVEDAILATDLPNLYILPSNMTSTPSGELLANSRWQELIGWCNESFKLILVDSPPILSLTDTELMSSSCDGVLMVVRSQFTKRDLLQKAAAQVDSKKLLGVVYNAADNSRREYSYSYYGYGAAK